jgi:hypothetical protein
LEGQGNGARGEVQAGVGCDLNHVRQPAEMVPR